MAPYTTGKSIGSQAGIPAVVRNAETPATGTGGASASQAVALPKQRFTGLYAFGVDVEFAGNPGAFELDVQVASVDADNMYVSIGTIAAAVVSADGVTYIATASFPQNTLPFARVLNKTANAGGFAQTVRVTPA